MASFAAQNRTVTKEDYLVRTLSMPPKFGRVVNANDKSQRGTEPIGPSNPKAKVFQSGT